MIAGNERLAPFHPEKRDEEQAEIVILPFGIESMMSAAGTDAAKLVQADRPGLNAADEQKQALASSINIFLSRLSANYFS
jgi:hypothetical protein